MAKDIMPSHAGLNKRKTLLAHVPGKLWGFRHMWIKEHCQESTSYHF